VRTLKKILPFVGKYRRDLILAVLFVVVESVIELFVPFVMAAVIDVGVVQRDIHFILFKGAEMVVLTALSFTAGMFYAGFIARAAYGFGAAVREAEYAAVQQYSFGDLDSFRTSSLVTRMTSDTTVLQNAVINGVRPMIRGPVMMVLGIFLAFRMNAHLSVIFLVLLPILAVIVFSIVSRIAPLYNVMQKAVDSVNTVVQEDLTAVRVIKAFVRGEYEENKFAAVNGHLREVTEKATALTVLNQPAFQTLLYTAMVLFMWMGGNMIIKGTLKVGELTGILTYVLQIMNSVMMISNSFLLLTRSLASVERIAEILERKPEIRNPENPVTEVKDGSVEFRDVSFKYGKNASEYTLEHVTLSFRAGQTIGIIGGTGSSKSTLVQLIPRLYDAAEGEVKVGGRNVKDYDLKVLHDAVGIVLQKNLLFSGTIEDNLKWGNEKATAPEVQNALVTAAADRFVADFPEGIHTELGQGGVNVSGGQKQRLCIARTVLKAPKILILDDAVSAVDTATERKIRNALSSLEDMTKIIIAQRVTSVMDADSIVIMDNGTVHAVGTHAELLVKDPIYQEIWRTQTGGKV
jgi:ABC-type multidrug transport system fused ATPase/permease subunit